MKKPVCTEHADVLEDLANNTLSGVIANYPLLQGALLEQGYHFHSLTPCYVVSPVVRWLVDYLKNNQQW